MSYPKLTGLAINSLILKIPPIRQGEIKILLSLIGENESLCCDDKKYKEKILKLKQKSKKQTTTTKNSS